VKTRHPGAANDPAERVEAGKSWKCVVTASLPAVDWAGRFAATFDGLIAEPSDGVTTPTDLLRDQAQQYGVLEQITDCGLELSHRRGSGHSFQQGAATNQIPKRHPFMTRPSDLARRRPLLTFFVSCYALSWALWIPLAVFRDAVPGTVGVLAVLIGSNVPSVMAIFLTVLSGRHDATRALLGQLLIWRVGVRWYLVLLGPTVLVLGAITGVAVVRGGPLAALAVPIGSAIITLAFMTFPGSALGEEIGWRGFALPRLQAGRSALTASLILGTLHAF